MNRTKKNKYNSLSLSNLSQEQSFNSRPETSPVRKKINSRTNSAFYSFSITKKPTSSTTMRSNVSPGQSQIYRRLDLRDKIQKIIEEESKKIYFKQRINYGQNLNAEELKKRLLNKIPQNAYKRNLKRKIKEKIKSKAVYEYPRRAKSVKKIDFNKNVKNLIRANEKIIRNFGFFSGRKEMRKAYNTLKIESNYFEKRSNEITNQNKDYNIDSIMNNILVDSKNPNKMSNKRYKTEKKQLIIRRKNKLKEKSLIFDNIVIDELNSNLEKIKKVKDEALSRNKINYAALTNKIILYNLMKQMKIVFIKDPTLNTLRANRTKRIADLKKEVSNYDDFQGLFNKYNDDITFSRYNRIKLSVPKFIKTKFKKNTNLKYGHIIDNYFGIPV